MDISDLRRKAEAGSTVAQGLLGIGYLYGYDGEVNYPEALRLLTESAKKGAVRPTVNLGHMYAKGLGVSRDIAKAIVLYEGVARVDFDAALALGRIFSSGVDVPKDRALAIKWYKVAASFEASLPDCQELEEARAFVRAEP